MTNEELLNKYPNGIILSAQEKLEIYEKLESKLESMENGIVITSEEAEKLHDTLNFLENSCYTLSNVVLIVKRQLALLRLNMKFSLEILPPIRSNSADFFSKEMEIVDAIIKTELDALNEEQQDISEQTTPESFGEENTGGGNSNSGESESAA